MGLRGFRRDLPANRPAPQHPDVVLRAELLDAIHGPRATATLYRRPYADTQRPSVAPRIEEIRDPDTRTLRRSLVSRARIAREGRAS